MATAAVQYGNGDGKGQRQQRGQHNGTMNDLLRHRVLKWCNRNQFAGISDWNGAKACRLLQEMRHFIFAIRSCAAIFDLHSYSCTFNRSHSAKLNKESKTQVTSSLNVRTHFLPLSRQNYKYYKGRDCAHFLSCQRLESAFSLCEGVSCLVSYRRVSLLFSSLPAPWPIYWCVHRKRYER